MLSPTGDIWMYAISKKSFLNLRCLGCRLRIRMGQAAIKDEIRLTLLMPKCITARPDNNAIRDWQDFP